MPRTDEGAVRITRICQSCAEKKGFEFSGYDRDFVLELPCDVCGRRRLTKRIHTESK